ncbi:MAG: aldehyde reductase [Nannocystaceae bacterium]
MSEAAADTTVLVTGASGFIAAHIIIRLLEEGYRVRGTVRSIARSAHVMETIGRHADASRLTLVEADLTRDEGWDAAVAGCRYVLHVASPLPRTPPKHERELIDPARDGTLRVLKAAARHDVARVVLTSSLAAVLYGHKRDGSEVYDEHSWSQLTDRVGAYEKSKTIAEQAAWEYHASLPAEGRFELVAVNPGLVLGPALDADYGTSGELVRKLLKRDFPGCPDVGWAVVDVRDVADAHLAAMTVPEAAGERFVCAVEYASMLDVARILDRRFRDRGYKVPLRRLPGWVLKLVGVFDRTAQLAVQELGLRQDISNAKIRAVLDWRPRGVEEMVVAMGESLIAHGVV